MKPKTNLHPENPNDCEYCKDSAMLKKQAKVHLDAIRSTFLLEMKPEELGILFKKCLVHAVATNRPKTIKAITDGLATVIKAFKSI